MILARSRSSPRSTRRTYRLHGYRSLCRHSRCFGVKSGRRQTPIVYLALGAVLWLFVFKSGVHATLAGVALALTVPLRASPGRPDDPASPLHILEHGLHSWVAFLIVPIFGLANAGVALGEMALFAPVPLGIAGGLFFGKQIGVFLTTWVAVKLDWADCPRMQPSCRSMACRCSAGSASL